MFEWQGRVDSEDGDKGLRWHQRVKLDINDDTSSNVDTSAKADTHQNLTQAGNANKHVSLVGFECDLGVMNNKGRVGAAAGPNAIRQALANLPWHWPDTTLTDVGNVTAEANLSQAQRQYANAIQYALQSGNAENEVKLVVGLGGGHEIAWGSYQGLFDSLSANKRVGIINFDAHFDLRKPAPNTSSGTPFRQVYEHCQLHNTPFHYACIGVSKAANTTALFEFADTSKTRYLHDTHCDFQSVINTLNPMLESIDELYVTICLDAFAASTAPGVSAPSALGISPSLVINTLRYLAQQQQVKDYQWRLCDIAEMNPQFDMDNRTAKLAARLIFEVTDALMED